MIHSASLALLGTWLLVYRLVLRTKLRWYAEKLTTVATGVALATLAPLLPFPPVGFRAVTLAAVGVLLSCCHPAATALVVSITLAIGLGGFLWQLGLCNVAPEQAWMAMIGTSPHALLLTGLAIVFIVFFVFVPGVAGPVTLIYGLVPMLGALMLTVGAAGLLPDAEGLSADALLVETPCAAASARDGASAGLLDEPAVRAFCAWAALALGGVALQCVLARLAARKAEQEQNGDAAPGGDLVASLLPNNRDQEDGPAGMPRPKDSNDRFSLITKAIFADEGADQSHLTDNERKLVEVCRKDEFERDRILWGGGLI